MVVLEAMTAAVPTVGTAVGGMRQLIADPLVHHTGRSWEACGLLVDPADIVGGMADAIQDLMANLENYETLARNARGRVEDFFQLHEAMTLYYRLYQSMPKQPARRHAPRPGPTTAVEARGVAKVPSSRLIWEFQVVQSPHDRGAHE